LGGSGSGSAFGIGNDRTLALISSPPSWGEYLSAPPWFYGIFFIVIFAGILILYILLLEPLHFWASSFLFLVGSFLFLKGAGWIRSIVIAIGMLVTVYVLFQYTFSVILW
jgi:hypothetical protein